MSLIFTETLNGQTGAAFGSTWGKITTGGNFYNNTAGGRTPGTSSMLGNGGGALMSRVVAAADEHATFIAGAAIATSGGWTYGTEASLLYLLSDSLATTHLSVTLDTAKKIRVYRGNLGTLLGTSTSTVMATPGTYYYVEVKATLHDSAGTVEVLVDGVSVLALTGVDTKNGGTKAVFDSVTWAAAASSWLASDFFICNGAGSTNNDFLYAPNIYWIKPNGNGASSQGVGSDGNSTNNYQLVDDAVNNPDPTDYVDLVNTGDKDTYTFTDVSGIPASRTVLGAMVWSLSQKTDAGARSLSHVARSSGGTETDVATAPALINGTFGAVGAAVEAVPGGGTWDVTELNAMEFGIKAS